MTNKQDPREQVEAFLQVIKEQHDLDDEKIRRIITTVQKNGRTYVTWAWTFSVLIALASFLAIRQLESIEKRLETIEHRQADVRERLKALEQIVAEHTKANH